MVPKIGEYHEHKMKWEHTNFQSNWTAANMNDLKKEIENIKKNEHIPLHLNGHDIHHYALLYLLTTIFFTAIEFMFLKYKKIKNIALRNIPIPLPR